MLPSLTRRAACFGAGAAALATLTGRAQARDWPTRPVTVIVPYAPGGNTDMMARLAGQYLASKLGQSFVIENRAGGGGSIGAIGVARAQPDGYTLLFGASTQIINIPMLQKVTYDPQKDFVPISIFGAGPYLLGVKASLPANTLQEFVAYVKANPGKLNYATAGEVEMYFGNASELMQHTDNKHIKILAVSTLQRLPQLPNVPTVAETYPGFDTSSWNGFFAPAGTPQAIVDVLAEKTIEAAKDPTIVDRLNRLAIVPFGTTSEEFKKVIEKSRVANKVAMKAAGLPIIE